MVSVAILARSRDDDGIQKRTVEGRRHEDGIEFSSLLQTGVQGRALYAKLGGQ